MAFDGIIIKSIVSELNTAIIGGKINKVFQPTKNDIIFGIYLNGKNYALHICIDSSNYRINLTTNSKSNPLVAPNFCMFLRKHVIGYKIKNITTIDLERIITIELEGYNELNDLITKKIVVELMGKHSNVILLNSNCTILDSLRHLDKYDGSYRDIMPARQYTTPITSKYSILNTKFSDFYRLLKNENLQSINKAISNSFIGISKSLIDYAIITLKITEITEYSINQLFSYILEIVNISNTENLSCVQFTNLNGKEDFALINKKRETNLDINFFIDDFYIKKEKKQVFIDYRNNLLRTISNLLNKYNKRLENINLKLNECSSMELYKKYGELITANLYRIKNKNTDYIELEDYYDNNRLIKIPLDNTISPANNAKKYFKKYNKLKNTLSIVSIQKHEAKKDLDYIESIIYELELSKSIEEIDDIYSEIKDNILGFKIKSKNNSELKKNRKKEINLLEYEVNGYKVFVGKNNNQNDYITFKLAEKNDIWLHTKDIHGSHVIIKTYNKSIDEDTLVKCAKIAANHSKASSSSNVPVDYTFVKFVKKPSGSKPGKVTYTNQKTIYV